MEKEEVLFTYMSGLVFFQLAAALLAAVIFSFLPILIFLIVVLFSKLKGVTLSGKFANSYLLISTLFCLIILFSFSIPTVLHYIGK
ncbi:Uncharacterised protein [Niallia circulans]|jgi:hypothetical protein|nr:hypothetical protein [Niallia circulans]MDR4315242.1 hypothetical protein [Niallia circulans]MED3840897.1 hypothetical protein [Niallia circulans]QKH61409.1 hypothetical protein FOC77_12525 [Niallia circulans]SPU11245.1 Uncharacterised protein [Niallia circulans]